MAWILPSTGSGTTYPQTPPGLALAGPPTGSPTVESGTTATSGSGWHAISRPAGAWAWGQATWPDHYAQLGFRPAAPSTEGVALSPGAGAGWWVGTKAVIVVVRADRVGLLVYDMVSELTAYESSYSDVSWPIIFARLTSTAIEVSGDGLVWCSMPWSDRATIEALTGSLSTAGVLTSVISSPSEQASSQVIHAD